MTTAEIGAAVLKAEGIEATKSTEAASFRHFGVVTFPWTSPWITHTATL
jgi:hypothetical protein